jgi:anti-anti-sigma factor
VNVRLETVGSITVIVPEGRLDFGTAGAFEKKLQDVLGATAAVPAAVIIDCGALDYVSSAGLRAILLAARGAQRASIGFALCALRPPVREVFDLSGFSRIITVHPDRATALAAAPPQRP